MFERLTRRQQILAEQIKREKEAQGQPTTGLTTTTDVERHHAKREEERKIADFQDTDPASGVPLCTPPSGLGRPLQFSGDVEWMPPIKFQNSDGTPAKRDGDTVTITVDNNHPATTVTLHDNYERAKNLFMEACWRAAASTPYRSIILDASGNSIPPSQIAEVRQTTGIGIRTAHDKRKIGDLE